MGTPTTVLEKPHSEHTPYSPHPGLVTCRQGNVPGVTVPQVIRSQHNPGQRELGAWEMHGSWGGAGPAGQPRATPRGHGQGLRDPRGSYAVL